ncbi:toll/interleukin-1 receptor domain-containing protein [candidate division KSB1 bacterium]|nr:toll/interleukin-1 receptor domain-containing protein [candidate division KSB1 bacterium]
MIKKWPRLILEKFKATKIFNQIMKMKNQFVEKIFNEKNDTESIADYSFENYSGKKSDFVKGESHLVHNQIFISYCHKDKYWCKKIMKHFSVLQRNDLVTIWYDRNCLCEGDEIKATIRTELQKSKIVICLLSEHYTTSKFILDFELPEIANLYNAGRVTIIPVALRHYYESEIPFELDKVLLKVPNDGTYLAKHCHFKQNEILVTFTNNLMNRIVSTQAIRTRKLFGE